MYNRDTIELLAPAGSLQSFYAAMENGADAVFCGLKMFSARAKAKNFTLDEVERLNGYAHEKGKKIFIALNTLIKEKELPALIDVLSALNQYRIDGLIIQDFGLYHLAKHYFPELALHASTQMAIHNSAGVRVLEEMGFSRAVLARELSLKEIAHIRKHSSLELEHFVHGALCYSISGHCLFSSYLDGRSGNRGACVQPCRRRYSYREKSGFYFSTSDFSAIDLIPGLIGAGITSFKIEGRMKSPEYVATVVAAYRMVIDAAGGDRKDAVKEARSMLKNAMGRKSTSGFLPGKGGADIVMAGHKGGLGIILGHVEQVRGKSVSFRSSESIYVGDRLRIQSEDDRSGKGFTVRTLYLGKRKVKRVNRGAVVSIPLPQRGGVNPGDTVFKLSTGKVFTMSEERARRLLASSPLTRKGVDLFIQCHGALLTVKTAACGSDFEKSYPVEMQPAERSPLSEETLHKVFCRTGQKQLSLQSLHAPGLPPVVIKPSRLKEIRRDFYENLLPYFLAIQEKQVAEHLLEVKRVVAFDHGSKKKSDSDKLFLVLDSLDELEALADTGSVQYIMALSSNLLQKYLKNPLQRDIVQQQLVWDLPSVVYDTEWSDLEKTVAEAIAAGCCSFRLNNPAQLEIFANIEGLHLWAGPWLYTMNSQAQKAMQEFAVQYHCLAMEDDKENVRALLDTDQNGRLLVTVYGPVDLFTSRIRSSFQKKEAILENDQGELFPVTEIKGVTVTRAPRPFSLLGRIGELRKMGCSHFIMDMRAVGLKSREGQQILQAFYDDSSLSQTTEFNFERGLQ